jgi:hypothetical protein
LDHRHSTSNVAACALGTATRCHREKPRRNGSGAGRGSLRARPREQKLSVSRTQPVASLVRHDRLSGFGSRPR